MSVRAIRRQSNRRYRVNYYFWDEYGFRHRGRKWFKTYQEAVAFYADRTQEFRQRKPAGSKRREHLTVGQFAAAHYIPWAAAHKRSWYVEKYILPLFLSKFGCRRLDEISPFDIEKWKIELQAKAAAVTIARYLDALRSFFKFASSGLKDENGLKTGGGFIGVNPMAQVSNPKIVRPRKPSTIMTPDELSALAPDGTRGADIALFALYSGMRRGEILRLRFADIDRTSQTIYIPLTKTGEPRTIPLHPVLAEIIDRQPKFDGCDFVFSWKGRPVKECRTAFGLLKKRLGITRRLRLHDLRHTFGSYLAMNGVDVDQRMALMGHKSYEAARIYTHYYTEKLRGSLDILTRAYESIRQESKGHEKGSVGAEVEIAAS